MTFTKEEVLTELLAHWHSKATVSDEPTAYGLRVSAWHPSWDGVSPQAPGTENDKTLITTVFGKDPLEAWTNLMQALLAMRVIR